MNKITIDQIRKQVYPSKQVKRPEWSRVIDQIGLQVHEQVDNRVYWQIKNQIEETIQ